MNPDGPISGRGGILPNFCGQFWRKHADQTCAGPVALVAFGDSVTMGSTANGLFIPEGVYHRRLARLIAEKFPGPASATLSVINAGIGGDTASMARLRLERDVIRHHPALVLVAFGANDLGSGPGATRAFGDAIRSIVSEIRERANSDMILVTPTRMAARDNEAAADKGYLRVLMEFQNGGTVARFAEVVREIGGEEGVPVADVYARWDKLEAEGADTTAGLANGLNHPNEEMHAIHAAAIFEIIAGSLRETQAPFKTAIPQ